MKKTFLLILVISIFLLNACGVGTQDKTETSEMSETSTNQTTSPITLTAEEIYNAVLTKLYNKLDIIIIDDTHLDGFGAQEGMVGVAEIAASRELDLLDKFGYTIADINEDGVSELLISTAGKSENNDSVGPRILCAYTVMDNKAQLLFEGDSKNCYYLLNDGTIYNVNLSDSTLIEENIHQINALSGGVYALGEGSSTISCIDFYFSDSNNYYHNQTGSVDTNSSKALEGGADAYQNINNDLAGRIKQIEITPLSGFNG